MVKPSITLFLVCFIVSISLAFTHALTKGKIEERARLDAENARIEVLSSANTFKEVEDLDAILGGKPGLSLIKEAYIGLNNGSETGYVFVASSKGYGGNIKITIGINRQGKLTGVKIGDNNETPGLGKKAADKPFLSQLVGITPQEPLSVVKGKSTKPEEVEAISGATITSKAVVDAVQAAVDISRELNEKGDEQK